MPDTVTWDVPPDQMLGAVYDQYAAFVWQTVYAICQKRAPEIKAWMQVNAPWTDRTGNARQTLHTRVIPDLAEIVILLAHGVYYGLYLELSNAGRYGILARAVDYWTPIILHDVQAALGDGIVMTFV